MDSNMQQSEEKKYYDMKVVPFKKEVTKVKNGKEYKVLQDNLSNEEIRNMSCEPRMFWRNNEHLYVAEMPLVFRGTGVKWSLFYVFEELTIEEQEKYEERSIMLPVTINSVVSVYGNLSKKKSESKKSEFKIRKRKKAEDKK